MKLQKFIKNANEVHNNKYDYSKTLYIASNCKVIITCPTHGDFEQRPSCHISAKQGCPKCGEELRHIKRQDKKVGTEEFIRKAVAIHKDKYNYSKTNYVSAKDNLTVICPLHGEFHQRPSNHLKGSGCPKCSLKGYSDTEWEALGKTSKFFTRFKLYVIECWSDTERFLKIGKTFTDITKRFKNSNDMPYNWNLLYSEVNTAKYISELERKLHKEFTSYIPNRPFNGKTECFTIEVKEQLKTVVLK